MANENVGGGNPGSGNEPGAGEGTGQQPQNAPGGGQQPVAGAGQQGQGAGSEKKVYTFTEDRSDWVPRHRLNEVSTKLTALEKETLTVKEQLALAEKRTRALVGVETPSEEQVQQEQIKEAIVKLFPGLKHLETLTADQLQSVLTAAQQAQAASMNHWERHALQVVTQVQAGISKAMGVEKLSDRQQARIKSALREEAVAAQAARQRDPHADHSNDFIARYERGDQTLIAEFVKEFLDDWVEPGRRTALAAQQRRTGRPVPRGERERTPITSGAPKVDFNNKDDFKKALLAARGAGAE